MRPRSKSCGGHCDRHQIVQAASAGAFAQLSGEHFGQSPTIGSEDWQGCRGRRPVRERSSGACSSAASECRRRRVPHAAPGPARRIRRSPPGARLPQAVRRSLRPRCCRVRRSSAAWPWNPSTSSHSIGKSSATEAVSSSLSSLSRIEVDRSRMCESRRFCLFHQARKSAAEVIVAGIRSS